MNKAIEETYIFGPFSLSVTNRVLLRGSEAVAIQPRIFDLLLCLVRNHERLITRDELIQQVWGPDVFVEMNSLNFGINMLRKILGDNATHPEYIQTFSKRGFRFIANVKKITNAYQKRTFAVLPFECLEEQSNSKLIQLGLMHMLNAKLSKLQEVALKPISSLEKETKPDSTPTEIGRKLQVDYVLSGVIITDNHQTRVMVSLININQEAIVWAESFDEYTDSILDLQDAISNRILDCIALIKHKL